MKKSLTYKILEDHLLEGTLEPGEEICIKIDQTLTQDSTGTMVYLQLEAMGIDEIQTELSAAYVDHNTLQTGFENADDHEFIKSAAAKYGIIFSKPGNGICHQLHLENFAKPGKTLIGSDSHTPTCGGLGTLSIGTGGLDVAAAMAGGKYFLKAPKVYNIQLEGSLKPWVSAKDVILYILKKLSVKGGVGSVIEYTGSGLKSLSVTDRATIANMGAELGATTSLFPSDEVTLQFLKSQGREGDWIPLSADKNADYHGGLVIDLGEITPLVAKPHSPDNVDMVENVKGLKVDQVLIGSCTNSSYRDLMKVAAILKGKRVHPDVSVGISPGSSSILKMLADNGALADLIAAGVRILECTCGPCIGMGQSPKNNGVSLRTFNRNFCGRSGTKSAEIYLVSPETAAVSAITGTLENPEALGEALTIQDPVRYFKGCHYFIFPKEKSNEIKMGPNIKPFPVNDRLPDTIESRVILKTSDHITTDDIMPSDAKLLPYRSNIPYLSKYCFQTIDEGFWEKCQSHGGGIIIGGENYGQGSSREHAALVPLYLGIKAVIAKSFARIHKANLINSGILPLEFMDQSDYSTINDEDELEIVNLFSALKGGGAIKVKNTSQNYTFLVKFVGSPRDVTILTSGGYLNYIKSSLEVAENA